MGCIVATAFKVRCWTRSPKPPPGSPAPQSWTVPCRGRPLRGRLRLTVQVPDLDAEERERWAEERARLREEAQAREAAARAAGWRSAGA